MFSKLDAVAPFLARLLPEPPIVRQRQKVPTSRIVGKPAIFGEEHPQPQVELKLFHAVMQTL